ncbi:MAG: bifunctional riboflavin kinase/FAD synthetase [Bacteriovoracaceae bacterium]
MKIVKSLSELSDSEEIVITIGNFDGVHIGHQFVIENIKRNLSGNQKLVLMTFLPHPREILSPDSKFLINTYDERRELLQKHNVDYLCEMKFDRNFSTLSPEEFLSDYLFNHSHIKKVYFGHDFKFGADKKGDWNLANDFCSEKGVEFELLKEHRKEDKRISSSLIRDLLIKGKIQEANHFLGREYFVTGKVIKGDGRGRKIGFPTANIDFSDKLTIPSTGVYITKSHVGDMLYYSVTNVGIKPTFQSQDELSIETHVFDFNRDIYGEDFRIHFLSKIRDEVKFSSVNDLISQIDKDAQVAKEFFKQQGKV